MIAWTALSRKIQLTLQEAFATPGTEPEVIAHFLISKLPRRPTSGKERPGLEIFLHERSLEEIVHFTRIENVPHILKFGIIPRNHLEEKAINIVLNPYFSDHRRHDNQPLANCLSFTYPNYRMFYKKRMDAVKGADWAVLSIDPGIIVDIYCEFSPTNAATSGVETKPGLDQAQRLFSGLDHRIESGLYPNETTSPEAEILEDTVIPPDRIVQVYVANEIALARLAKEEIHASIREEYFWPRRDYKKWQNGFLFNGSNDYEAVLDYENKP